MVIELEGIIATINDYSRDHFIRNYTKLLTKLDVDEEKDKMIIVCNRLLEWYQGEIESIRNNKYIFNKTSHEKSIILLTEMERLLKE